MDDEEEKISKLLGELKKVSAPKNFQYQVNARIAKGRPETGVRGYFTFLKYAVPLAAMVLVVGIVAIQTNFMYDVDAVPAVAVEQTDQPFVKEEPQQNGQMIATDGTLPPIIETAVAENKISGTPLEKKRKDIERNRPAEGGSYDATLRSPRETILPPGIQNDPQPTPVLTGPLEKEPIAVNDVLGQLGINAKQIDGVWSVADVKKGSLAERSGIKKDDIIQAIDERQLKGIKEFRGSISGKQITIVRDGKVIVLGLR